MHGQWFRAVIVLRRCELFRLYKRHVGSFSGQLYAMRVRYPCRNNTDHSYSRNNPYDYDTDTRIADYNIGMFGKHTGNAVEPRYSSAVMVDGSTLSRIPRRAGMLLRCWNRIVAGCRNKSGIDNLWYRHYNPHVHWIGGGCYSRIGNDNGWKKKRFKPPTRRTFNPEITFLRRKQPEGPRL